MTPTVLFTESSPHLGGQELQLLQQMAALEACGVGATLACRPGSAVAERARQAGLNRLELPLRRATDVASLAALRRFIVERRPAAVIGHSGHDANLGLLAAWSVRARPRLLRSKTYLAGRHPSPLTHSRLVDAVLVPSAWMREQLLLAPGIAPDRVQVLYPGVDFARLRSQAGLPLPEPLRRWLAEGEGGPLVVQVGMLRGEKGHALALQAVADVVRRFPGLRYLAAGSGPEREALEQQAQALGLAARVRFEPVHPVAPVLAAADLLLMPSSREPLGMAQVEALGLGIPVLASRVGGIPETVRDGATGRLLPPDDPAVWAEAMATHLADPLALRRLAEAGRGEVEARFSVQANTRSLLAHCGLGGPGGLTAPLRPNVR